MRFIGQTHFQQGETIGVELDAPVGIGSGSVKKVAYFKCQRGHAVFVRRQSLVKEAHEARRATSVKLGGGGARGGKQECVIRPMLLPQTITSATTIIVIAAALYRLNSFERPWAERIGGGSPRRASVMRKTITVMEHEWCYVPQRVLLSPVPSPPPTFSFGLQGKRFFRLLSLRDIFIPTPPRPSCSAVPSLAGAGGGPDGGPGEGGLGCSSSPRATLRCRGAPGCVCRMASNWRAP